MIENPTNNRLKSDGLLPGGLGTWRRQGYNRTRFGSCQKVQAGLSGSVHEYPLLWTRQAATGSVSVTRVLVLFLF